jgi:predicted transcriptional regulator
MPTHPTIHEDYLISLIDGQHYVLLKKHLYKHGYTPESYREAFSLPDDYPMIAAGYSKRRSAIARQIDHTHRWDPNTNMPLSERRATGAPYRSKLDKPRPRDL